MNPYETCPVFENENYLLRLIEPADTQDLLLVYSDEKAVPFFNGDNCNGDDFHYTTLERMQSAVDFWCQAHREGWFVRWVILDKHGRRSDTTSGSMDSEAHREDSTTDSMDSEARREDSTTDSVDSEAQREDTTTNSVDSETRSTGNTAIGTIELFNREAEDYFTSCALLRLDLRSDYERADSIYEILSLIVPQTYEMFGSRMAATKVPPFAAERKAAVEKLGFTLSEEVLTGSDDGKEYKDYYVLSKSSD